MKDFTHQELEATRPSTDIAQTLAYCLAQLYADRMHTVTQEIVHGLTFEELIGTLLQARDLYEQVLEMEREDEEDTAPRASARLAQF